MLLIGRARVQGIIAPTHSKSKTGTPTGAGAQARAAIWFPFPGDFNTGGEHAIERVLTPIRTLHAHMRNGLECDSLPTGGSDAQDQN